MRAGLVSKNNSMVFVSLRKPNSCCSCLCCFAAVFFVLAAAVFVVLVAVVVVDHVVVVVVVVGDCGVCGETLWAAPCRKVVSLHVATWLSALPDFDFDISIPIFRYPNLGGGCLSFLSADAQNRFRFWKS